MIGPDRRRLASMSREQLDHVTRVWIAENGWRRDEISNRYPPHYQRWAEALQAEYDRRGEQLAFF